MHNNKPLTTRHRYPCRRAEIYPPRPSPLPLSGERKHPRVLPYRHWPYLWQLAYAIAYAYSTSPYYHVIFLAQPVCPQYIEAHAQEQRSQSGPRCLQQDLQGHSQHHRSMVGSPRSRLSPRLWSYSCVRVRRPCREELHQRYGASTSITPSCARERHKMCLLASHTPWLCGKSQHRSYDHDCYKADRHR